MVFNPAILIRHLSPLLYLLLKSPSLLRILGDSM